MSFSPLGEKLADYVETQPEENRESELNRITEATGKTLSKCAQWRAWEATKEFIRAHHEGWLNVDLADEPWFIDYRYHTMKSHLEGVINE